MRVQTSKIRTVNFDYSLFIKDVKTLCGEGRSCNEIIRMLQLPDHSFRDYLAKFHPEIKAALAINGKKKMEVGRKRAAAAAMKA